MKQKKKKSDKAADDLTKVKWEPDTQIHWRGLTEDSLFKWNQVRLWQKWNTASKKQSMNQENILVTQKKKKNHTRGQNQF